MTRILSCDSKMGNVDGENMIAKALTETAAWRGDGMDGVKVDWWMKKVRLWRASEEILAWR